MSLYVEFHSSESPRKFFPPTLFRPGYASGVGWGGRRVDPKFFLLIDFSRVEMSLYVEFQPHKLSRTYITTTQPTTQNNFCWGCIIIGEKSTTTTITTQAAEF